MAKFAVRATRDLRCRVVSVGASRAPERFAHYTGGAKASAYRYGAGSNLLTHVAPPAGAAVPLAHDADGAVSALGAMALSHDGPGGLASSVRTPASSLAYQAGFDGERVLKRVSGQQGALKRLTIRSGAATLMELDTAGRQETYAHGPIGLVSLIADGQDHAVSRDQRGSVRAAWAGSKANAAFDYLPFGALDGENSRLADPFAERLRRRYTGQEWEAETGLYCYHARLYDPALARFLSPDPAGQGASPYAYVGGDPSDFVDPTGRWLRAVLLKSRTLDPDRLGFFSTLYGDLVLTVDAVDAAGRPFDYARFHDIQERYSHFIGEDHFDDGLPLNRQSVRHFDRFSPGWRRIYQPEVRFQLLLERATLATPEEAALISPYSYSHSYELPHWSVADPPTLSGRYLGRARRIPRPVREIQERVAPYDAQPAFPHFTLPSHEDFMAARGYMEGKPELFGRSGYLRLLSTADRRYGRVRTFSEAFDYFTNISRTRKRRRVEFPVPRELPSELSFDLPSDVPDYLLPHYNRPPSPGGGGGGAAIPPVSVA